MIEVTETNQTTYRPLFSKKDIAMSTATLKVDGHILTVSHREDDPEGVWAVDSHIMPNGMPVFVHGAGDRTTMKKTITNGVISLILSKM